MNAEREYIIIKEDTESNLIFSYYILGWSYLRMTHRNKTANRYLGILKGATL